VRGKKKNAALRQDHQLARYRRGGVALARKTEVERLHRAPGLSLVLAPCQERLILEHRLAVAAAVHDNHRRAIRQFPQRVVAGEFVGRLSVEEDAGEILLGILGRLRGPLREPVTFG
jgi:hypothetical protein